MTDDAAHVPPPGYRLHGHDGGFANRNGPIFVADIPGGDTVMLAATAGHLNGAGIVSGGMLLLLLDIAMGIAISARCGGPAIHCPTIQMSTNFLAPARPDHMLIGSAEIERLTRSVAFLRAAIRCGDQLVATATGVYRVPPAVVETLFPSERKTS